MAESPGIEGSGDVHIYGPDGNWPMSFPPPNIVHSLIRLFRLQIDWRTTLRDAWSIDPRIAIHMGMRFSTAGEAIESVLTDLVYTSPASVMEVPEASPYVLQIAEKPTPDPQLRVCYQAYKMLLARIQLIWILSTCYTGPPFPLLPRYHCSVNSIRCTLGFCSMPFASWNVSLWIMYSFISHKWCRRYDMIPSVSCIFR